jgi:hypothetical protein
MGEVRMDERSAYASGTKRVAQKSVSESSRTLMVMFCTRLHRKEERVEKVFGVPEAVSIHSYCSVASRPKNFHILRKPEILEAS